MARLFYHVMQDNLGNLLFSVTGTMRLAGSGTLATIYGDEALTVILPNPMTNHPSFGSFKCYLGAGSYDFYMAKAGYTFETLTGVQGLGSMAQQNANAVAITGGTATGLTTLQSVKLGVQQAPNANAALGLFYLRATENGLVIMPQADTGPGNALMFLNTSVALVGSITTTGAATAYNTASDARLKHAISALTGALGVVQALRPVTFRWNADESTGHGFLAHELQREIPDAVSGEPDAVHEDGSIRPQQVDHSKLVVWLVSAVQELAARVVSLEQQLRI